MPAENLLTNTLLYSIIYMKREKKGIEKMAKEIWFDMDGTIANLYVGNWLEMIIAENPHPYKVATPLVNMQVLARTLNKLQKNGYKIGIISWTARNGSLAYNNAVKKAKMNWLKTHMNSVHFDNIDIVEYGTPKEIGRNGILFDDEKVNRDNWNGIAYDVHDIIGVLKNLA